MYVLVKNFHGRKHHAWMTGVAVPPGTVPYFTTHKQYRVLLGELELNQVLHVTPAGHILWLAGAPKIPTPPHPFVAIPGGHTVTLTSRLRLHAALELGAVLELRASPSYKGVHDKYKEVIRVCKTLEGGRVYACWGGGHGA